MRRAVLGLAVLASACSVITGAPPTPSPRCVLSGGADPCAELEGGPFHCVVREGDEVGVCQPAGCAAVDICGNGVDDDCDGTVDNGSPETCNGLDDDCDGTIDNGPAETCNGRDDDCDTAIDEDLDEDGDGYTWCPTGPTLLDCDDSNDAVFPGRSGDPCDGLDNDCDPATPDGTECGALQDCDPLAGGCVDVNCTTRPSLCSADQFCDESTSPPTCRLSDMTCLGSRTCPAGQVCNPATADCVTPQASGAFCDQDAECESHLCVPIQALRVVASHVMDRGGVCGRSCCSDTDCGSQETCWASGSGARACVPTSLLEMGSGGAPGSSTCSARRECSSECRISLDDAYEVRDRVSLACGDPFAGSSACSWDIECFTGYCLDGRCGYQACFSVGDCASGLCVSGNCRDACGRTSDCPTSGRMHPPACIWVAARSPAGRDDFLSVCSYSSDGTGAGGSPCRADTECRDRTCVDDTGDPLPAPGTPMRCADTCCADASCGAGEQCRPILVHGHWENHCLPEPTFTRGGPGGSTG